MYIKNPDYFLAIVREGSISRAAEQLYLSQPYLSQYLARLEKDLGCILIDRSHTPLVPTAAGELFLAFLRQERRLHRKLDTDLRHMRTEKKQIVRIGLALWRGASLLPDVLPAFSRAYPDVQVLIHEDSAPQLEGMLFRGEADFCISQIPHDTTNVTYETLLHERILLVGKTSHPIMKAHGGTLNEPAPISLRLLEDERFILLPPEWQLGQTVRNAFYAEDIQPDETILTTNLTTAVNLVGEGMGFTFLPETGAKRCHDIEKLSFCTVGNPPMSSSLSILYKKDCFFSPAARAFIDMAKQCYAP